MSLCPFVSLSLCLTVSLSLCLSLPLSPSLTLSLAQTRTHTHTNMCTHTRTVTVASVSFKPICSSVSARSERLGSHERNVLTGALPPAHLRLAGFIALLYRSSRLSSASFSMAHSSRTCWNSFLDRMPSVRAPLASVNVACSGTALHPAKVDFFGFVVQSPSHRQSVCAVSHRS